MAQAQIHNTAGAVVSTVDLSDAVFGVARNDTLIHQAVLRIHANRRAGTHDTKTRGEVSGTTAKWYRQKGTGRARHGAQTAPQFRKGGVVFGPHPRSYRQDLPQKMRRKALCSVLSDKLAEGRIHIVDGFAFAAPRTKDMIAVLSALGVDRRVLIVLSTPDENVTKSARNIPRVRTTTAYTLNVVDAIDSDHLIFTQAGLRALETVLTGGGQPALSPEQPAFSAQPTSATGTAQRAGTPDRTTVTMADAGTVAADAADAGAGPIASASTADTRPTASGTAAGGAGATGPATGADATGPAAGGPVADQVDAAGGPVDHAEAPGAPGGTVDERDGES